MNEESDSENPYRYEDSGIEEHHGHIPVWLWLVVVGLAVWSAYYTVDYWVPR